MSEGILSRITKTINRQVLGLATTLAYFNHLRLLENPREKLFQITVGGLEYTGNLQNLVNCYYFEENYWYYFTQRNSELNSPFIHKVTVSAGRRSLSPPPDFVDLGSTSESSSPATNWSDGSEDTSFTDAGTPLREVEDDPGRNGTVSSNGRLIRIWEGLNDSVVQPVDPNDNVVLSNGKEFEIPPGLNDIVVQPKEQNDNVVFGTEEPQQTPPNGTVSRPSSRAASRVASRSPSRADIRAVDRAVDRAASRSRSPEPGLNRLNRFTRFPEPVQGRIFQSGRSRAFQTRFRPFKSRCAPNFKPKYYKAPVGRNYHQKFFDKGETSRKGRGYPRSGRHFHYSPYIKYNRRISRLPPWIKSKGYYY